MRARAESSNVFASSPLYEDGVSAWKLMDLFATLRNEKFFSPLTSVNKRIYFECITKLIEESINKYYRLANMRIRLVTSNGLNLQSSIDAILTKIKESEQNEKNEILGRLQTICSKRDLVRNTCGLDLSFFLILNVFPIVK